MWIGPIPGFCSFADRLTGCHATIYPATLSKLRQSVSEDNFLRLVVDMNRFALMAEHGGLYVDIDVDIVECLDTLYVEGFVNLPVLESGHVDIFFIMANKEVAQELLNRFEQSKSVDILEYVNVTKNSNEDILHLIPHEKYAGKINHHRFGSWCMRRDNQWLLEQF